MILRRGGRGRRGLKVRFGAGTVMTRLMMMIRRIYETEATICIEYAESITNISPFMTPMQAGYVKMTGGDEMALLMAGNDGLCTSRAASLH